MRFPSANFWILLRAPIVGTLYVFIISAIIGFVLAPFTGGKTLFLGLGFLLSSLFIWPIIYIFVLLMGMPIILFTKKFPSIPPYQYMLLGLLLGLMIENFPPFPDFLPWQPKESDVDGLTLVMSGGAIYGAATGYAYGAGLEKYRRLKRNEESQPFGLYANRDDSQPTNPSA